MKKTFLLFFMVFILLGCATSGQSNLRDFNSEFGENIPTDPQYKIDAVGANRYQVVVYQGKALISERTTRASYLTRAALLSMEAHCIKNNSILDEYQFQDRTDGWGYINVLGFFTCKASY